MCKILNESVFLRIPFSLIKVTSMIIIISSSNGRIDGVGELRWMYRSQKSIIPIMVPCLLGVHEIHSKYAGMVTGLD